MHHIILLFLIFFSLGSIAQNLSGIVNSYYRINSINLVQSSVAVSNAAGLNPGDSAMIFQMQGAIIDQSTDPLQHGYVVNYSGAGNFELVEICSVSGNNVFFKKMLVNGYYSAGSIQLVKFTTTLNANISGTLSGQSWDGSTGGVVVIYDLGTLNFNANIDVSSLGFRGGQHSESTYSCSFLSDNPDMSYLLSDGLGAQKGEGISNFGTLTAGRGPTGNGGGGGNDHNSGGGGGSNTDAGGIGGENDDPGTFNCKGYYPGIGGRPLLTSGSKMFMGGGGGAGHSNSTFNSSGANGGGIVLIIAQSIMGNGYSILASGDDAVESHGDGAGGGGAGGSVFLNTNTITGGLMVDVHGGDGGNTDASAAANTNRCFGPGGGGAGGLIRFGPGTLTGVSTILNGGTSGIVVNSTAGCNNTSVNATNGNSGGIESNGVIIESIKCNNECPLVTNVDLGPDQNICDGDLIVLNTGNPGLPHFWSTGETTDSITVSTGGLYKVEIHDVYCIACDSVLINISPGLNVPDVTSFNQCNSTEITLDGENPGSEFMWSTGDTTQTINVMQSGIYNVQIVNGNCSIDFDFEIIACLFIPNTISPNGDGSNDFWEIDGLEDYPEHAVHLYNRRNQLVFSETGYQNSFSGDGLPAGVYYYKIELGTGFEERYGTLTIIR